MHSTMDDMDAALIAAAPQASAQSFAAKAALVVAATGLMALAAHVSVPLPFSPVPLTLQTFAVLLIGMSLGPVMGFAAMVLYLAEGASGLPVFSPHGPGGVAQLLGPTAGFLFSYPLAAAAAGWLSSHLVSVRSLFIRGLVAGTVASPIFFVLGAGWLIALTHVGALTAWHVAVAPFLPGEVVKVVAAAILFSSLRRWKQS